MRFGLMLPLALIMLGSRGNADSINQFRHNAAGGQQKTYSFNIIPFEVKAMELSPDALNRQKLRLSLRNGIQLAIAIDAETLVPTQCGLGSIKVAGVEVAHIDTSQIYCVWLRNGDLVAGRAARIEGQYPIVVIEIAEVFQRRRPGDRSIGK